jgi:iron(III) transport system substrate-binding protein
MKKRKIVLAFALLTCLSQVGLASCSSSSTNVVIFTSLEDYRIARLETELKAKFPDKTIVVQYLDTGTLMSRLQSEGASSDCDIMYDVEATNSEKLIEANSKLFADLSSYDTSHYLDDVLTYQTRHHYYHIFDKEAGGIVLNAKVLKEKGLAEPTSFNDLLDSKYKGLIEMPNPKTSGTGYYWFNGLVSTWGEDKAIAYFDSLSTNIKEFTTSGSGPVKALDRGEVAIGLGMTFQAALYANSNSDLKITYFEEGSPYNLFTQAVINGKEKKDGVKEVYDYLYNTFTPLDKALFCPETIYKPDYQPASQIPNYPTNVKYMSMKGLFDPDYKTALLDKWTH